MRLVDDGCVLRHVDAGAGLKDHDLPWETQSPGTLTPGQVLV